MGYTHYWRRAPSLPCRVFKAAVSDCQRILAHTGIPLAGPIGIGVPVIRCDAIAFNGPGQQGLETFGIKRRATPRNDEEDSFDFCKTNHQPYDICVQVALIVLAHHFGASFQVSSDGGDSNWAAARRLCQEHLGYGDDFQLIR